MRGDRTGKKVKKPAKTSTSKTSGEQSDVPKTESGSKSPEETASNSQTDSNTTLKPDNPNDETTPQPEKFVNIENIQVNVTNEERKLCSGQEVPTVSSNDETIPTTMSSSNMSASVTSESTQGGDRPQSPIESSTTAETTTTTAVATSNDETGGSGEQEYVNPRGVRFVQESSIVTNSTNAANLPYGLPCVRELLRFLISLIGSKNSELMISMGLNLITIGLESGIDHLASYQSLLAYVRDDLCKNLYNLLSVERLGIYTNVLRVTFLLFESLRGHLKLQIEHMMGKLMEIIVSESSRVSGEQKEITLDFLVQILRIPGFAIELYLNYDCSLNSTNLFEDLIKLLSKVSI